jgi:hypothetical protein
MIVHDFVYLNWVYGAGAWATHKCCSKTYMRVFHLEPSRDAARVRPAERHPFRILDVKAMKHVAVAV